MVVFLYFKTYKDGAEQSPLTLAGSNVGIATTSPAEKLEIAGNIFVNTSGNPNLTVKTSGAGNNPYVRIQADSNYWDLQTLFSNTNNELDFRYNGSSKMIIDNSGNVGINTSSPSAILEVRATAPTYTNNGTVFWGGTTNNDDHNGIMLSSYGNALGGSIGSNLNYSNGTVSQTSTNRSSGEIQFGNTTTSSVTSEIKFGGYVKGSTTFLERMRISSAGDVSIGTTSNTNDVADASSGNGFAYSAEASRDFLAVTRDSGVTAYFNRIGNGDVIAIRKNGATKGTISVNDATVSYNPFMGSHYSETSDSEILLGTVMEYTGELVENYNIEEKRLSKVKISDTSESTKVYGIYFANGDEIGGDLIAGLGASWCRINKDVTVQLGDLLVSNGDGTAKVQSDDIIRSKTIGKVTSTTVKETYSDGSYVVPVVLYCG